MTFEELDRTIFELIRLQVVAAGYLPDITAYGSESAYVAAREALRDSLPDKQLIDVFGVGSPKAREEIIDTKIVIDRQGTEPGSIGAWPSNYFKDNGDDTFDKIMMPPHTEDITYDIRILTNRTKFERIARDIIRLALGTRKYITSITTSENAFIQMVDDTPLTATEDIEISLRFMVSDIFLDVENTELQNIVQMTTVYTKLPVRESTIDLDSEAASGEDTEITYTDTQ